MATLSLEKILARSQEVLNISLDKEYKTIDAYTTKTIALYTPPVKIYDLPNIGVSIHLHGTRDGNILFGGTVKAIGSNDIIARLNSYESATADYYLSKGLGLGIGKLIEPKNK